MEEEYEETKEPKSQMAFGSRGTKDRLSLVASAFLTIIGIGLLLAFAPLAKNVFGGEREGAIEVEDCRESVIVEEGSFTTYVNKFTCVGNLYCCRVELEDGICRTAFCYVKEVEISDINF